MRNTLLKLSRLPLKERKSFEGYDFSRLHGDDVEALKSLASLSEVNAGKNIAFVGPPGVVNYAKRWIMQSKCRNHKY